jgi:iron(III) transport system ATP-binding protein
VKPFALNDRRLAVDGAVVRFAPGRPAVDRADLTLTCGRVTALLGPSGSGKSTLLRAIAGLEKLDEGAVRFEGRIWSGEGVHLQPETRRCGVVFQDYALFPHLTALANVAFGLRGSTRAQKREAALARLETVELAHRAGAYPHELSGGEQQRIALARAAAVDTQDRHFGETRLQQFLDEWDPVATFCLSDSSGDGTSVRRARFKFAPMLH